MKPLCALVEAQSTPVLCLSVAVVLWLKKNNWKINSSGSKGNFGANWSSQIKKDELAIVEKICGKNFKKYNFTKQSKKKLYSENLIKNFCENPKKILSWTNKKIFLKYLPKEIAKL